MAHTHFCKTCFVLVAVCDASCQQEGDHYCSVHNPDPAKRHPNDLPVRMKVQIAKEGE